MSAEHLGPAHLSTSERDDRPRVEKSAESAPDTSFTAEIGVRATRSPETIAPAVSLPQAGVLQLQRSHGNAFVGRRLSAFATRTPLLQRHPEGFEPTVNPEEATEEIANPKSLSEETVSVAPADGEAPAPTPEESTSEIAEGMEPEQTANSGPEVAPATKGAPAPVTPKAMDLAKAQEVLTKSFGKVKKIVPGKISLLADRAAIWVKYDEINKGRKNPYNGGAAWKDGDAKKYIPGLDGFASKDTGTVYVNQQTTLATATAHEVLHNNTEAGFRKAVGETINEGATEYLAIKALKASSVSIASGTAYPGEVAFVTKLVALVTEDILISAYFGGASTLTDAFDKKQGTGAFAKMKPIAEAKNYTEANKLVVPVPAKK